MRDSGWKRNSTTQQRHCLGSLQREGGGGGGGEFKFKTLTQSFYRECGSIIYIRAKFRSVTKNRNLLSFFHCALLFSLNLALIIILPHSLQGKNLAYRMNKRKRFRPFHSLHTGPQYMTFLEF